MALLDTPTRRAVSGMFVLLALSSLLGATPTVAGEDPEPGASDDEATPAEAQPPEASPPPRIVEKIVVSATVAEDRRDAATFTNLTRQDIEARDHGQDLAMLLSDTPGAYAYSDAGNGIGYSYLSLRGFDQRRIAVNINGIPLNTPETHQVYYIDLADLAGGLNSIQVQRGTGTALYGSPAVGGVVNLETGHLATTEGGQVQIGIGSFGTRRVSGQYGGPLAGGRWAWMARASHVRSDGYRIPSWTRHTLFQLGLERFGEDSVLRIHLFGGPESTQLAYYGVPVSNLNGGITGNADHDRRINPLKPGETDTFFQPHLQLLHDWRLADGVFLLNTGYVILGDGYYRQFSDGWTKRWIGQYQLGWITRVSWDHGAGTLIAGAEMMAYSGRHKGTLEADAAGNPVPSAATLYDFRNRKTSFSLFAREMLRPAPSVAVNLEIQATHHTYAMRDDRIRGLSFDAGYTFLTPRVGANWNLNELWNVYGSVSTARSEPAFRDIWNPEDPYSNPAALFHEYDPSLRRYSDPIARAEKLLDLETGVGYARGAARFKAGLYRMQFQDELVFAGGIDNDGNPITDNAGRSVHDGIELEAAGRLPAELDVSGHLSLSRDVFQDYTLLSPLESGEVLRVDHSGNRIALFPDHQARLRVSRLFGPARVALGARRVGTIYLDNSQDERKNPGVRRVAGYVPKKIEPFTVADFQTTVDLTRFLPKGRFSLSLDLVVENLFDRSFTPMGYSYPTNAEYTDFQTEFFPGATRSVFLGLTLGL